MRNSMENDFKCISVIVPVYNEHENIAGCLQSIMNQHYPTHKIETIVVDDGSTDQSIKIARELGAKVYQQEHAGPGAARNRGVHEASASIIAFLDADDRACESWLREAVVLLDKDEVAAVGCNHDLLNKENDLVKIEWLERNFRLSNSPERVDHLGTSGCLYKKIIFQDSGGFDISLLAAEDMDLSARVKKQGGILYLIKKSLIYVQYPNSWLHYFQDQVRKSGYLIQFRWKSRNTKRKLGDSYSGLRDYVQSLLPFIFILCLIFIAPSYFLAYTSVLFLLLLYLNSAFIDFVFKKRHEIEFSHFWPAILFVYFFVRASSWSLGLIYGLWLIIRSKG